MSRRPKRDAAVDGLRGLMLLIIVITHYVPSSFFSGNIARPAAAVMLAVTGYFFMRIAKREPALAGSFLERCSACFKLFFQRHMRIWPVVAGVVLLYVGLGYLDPSPTTMQIHRTWPLYLGYMGNVVKMIFEGQAFPAQFWLIGAQEQFIFLTFVAMAFVGRDRMKALLVGAVVVGVAARIIGCVIWMPGHPSLATESPFAVADALSLGMLCQIAIAQGSSTTGMRRHFIVAALVTLFVWAELPNTYAIYFGLVPLLTAIIGCLVILTLADEVRVRRLERTMLSWPALVVLGQMSLSLFLLHPLVNVLIVLGYARLTAQVIPWWALAAAGPPSSILVAFLYFRAVEIPLRRLRSNIAKPRAPVDPRLVSIRRLQPRTALS